MNDQKCENKRGDAPPGGGGRSRKGEALGVGSKSKTAGIRKLKLESEAMVDRSRRSRCNRFRNGPIRTGWRTCTEREGQRFPLSVLFVAPTRISPVSHMTNSGRTTRSHPTTETKRRPRLVSCDGRDETHGLAAEVRGAGISHRTRRPNLSFVRIVRMVLCRCVCVLGGRGWKGVSGRQNRRV